MKPLFGTSRRAPKTVRIPIRPKRFQLDISRRPVRNRIGCTRDCQNGLASTILNSPSQPCQLQDACAQHTTNGVRVEYTSGTVDRTYLELVALYYRAGPQGALFVRICARPRPPSNTEDRAQQAQQAPAPRLAIRRFAVGLERRSAHPRPKGHTASMVHRNRLCSVPRQYVSDVLQEGL